MLSVTTMNTVSQDMVNALKRGDSSDESFEPTRGNIAAHLYNVTVGTDALDGIQLGWADKEASTDFLNSIVDDVDDMWGDIIGQTIEGVYADKREAWDDLRDNGRDMEIADGAIPISTYNRVIAALELGLGAEEPEMAESHSLDSVAAALLFELAEQIISALVERLLSNAENA